MTRKIPHNARLKGNLKKNYLFLGISYISLTQGLWMIWLSLRGYSLTELGALEGIFHLTSFLMEVPTGLVADRRGLKTAFALLAAMASLIYFLYLAWGRISPGPGKHQ